MYVFAIHASLFVIIDSKILSMILSKTIDLYVLSTLYVFLSSFFKNIVIDFRKYFEQYWLFKLVWNNFRSIENKEIISNISFKILLIISSFSRNLLLDTFVITFLISWSINSLNSIFDKYSKLFIFEKFIVDDFEKKNVVNNIVFVVLSIIFFLVIDQNERVDFVKIITIFVLFEQFSNFVHIVVKLFFFFCEFE